LKRFRKKRFAELTRPVERPMGSETLSSGERFALVNATLQSDPGNSANASLRIGIQGAMH
uniref:hypothetical protein n=1 Tax=Leptospira noguchii TaxID=28182 RepID=UPI001F337600